MVTYSVLIPCYNETHRIEKTIKSIRMFLDMHPGSEAIFVDDGSKDGTGDFISRKIKAYDDMLCVGYKQNRGKWGAIIFGTAVATKDWCILCDADYSVDLNIIVGTEFGSTVIIGNRYHKENNIPMKRKIPGLIFNFLARKIVGIDYLDTQCMEASEELCYYHNGSAAIDTVENIYKLCGDMNMDGETYLFTKYGAERIINKFKGFASSFIEINGSYGTKFTVTENHPVLCNGIFKDAKDVVVGDILEGVDKISIPYKERTDIFFRDICSGFDTKDKGDGFVLKGGRNIYPNKIERDDDYFYFMGLFQAEGSLDSNNRRCIRLSFNESERSYINFVKKYCLKIGGSHYIYWDKKKHCKTISVSCMPLVLHFANIFGENGRNNKVLSKEILDYDDCAKFSFLDGLFCGDGCFHMINKKSHLSLSMCGKNRYRIRLLLLSLGIRCGICKESRKRLLKDNKSTNQISVRIVSEDIRKFISRCPHFINTKVHRYKANYSTQHGILRQRIIVSEICKINRPGYYYGFETEFSHTLLNDGVVTHNTPSKGWSNTKEMRSIFLNMNEEGFAGDVEFLRRCDMQYVDVKTINVKYEFTEGSSVNVRKHAPKMFSALIRIRNNTR